MNTNDDVANTLRREANKVTPMTHPNVRATEAEQPTPQQIIDAAAMLVRPMHGIEFAETQEHFDNHRTEVGKVVARLIARAEQAEKERDEANAKAGACNYAAKELVGGALKAVKVAKAAFEREGWEDGPTIPEAETTLGNAIGNITDFGVDGYLNRIKTLTDLTVKLKSERDAARREAEGAKATLNGPALTLAKLVVDMQERITPMGERWSAALECARHVIADATDALARRVAKEQTDAE